jgi:FimV-like protein
MPNGGSDNCATCRHNRVNVGRQSTPEERRAPAFCTIRNVEVRASHHTYCANHFKSLRVPLGPMYTSHCDEERIPYHGSSPPREAETARCALCGGGSADRPGVHVQDAALGPLEFCGPRHYVRWWKQAHPGEALVWDCDAPAANFEEARALEAGAMLELARAYIEMADAEGAREVLEELLRGAAGPQREEARALLEALAKGSA